MFHILIEVFGGIGLFFVGINYLSDGIKKLGSGYTPAIVKAFSKSDTTSAIGGLLSGIATSSGKAVTFSLLPIAELGQLDLRKCLPIVMGGSVGSAFIVLYASFDFEIIVFLLMGIAGALMQFGNQKDKKLKLITHVILGFALLFYGLDLIKLGAAPVKNLPWFSDFMAATQGHWLLAVVVGALLAFLSQSGSSVAIIAMSLVSGGLLGYDEAVMLVFGTNVGSGFSTAILGMSLRGIGRQLVFFHGFFKIIGIAILVPLYIFESNSNLMLVKGVVQQISDNSAMQIAIIYLMYELITGMFISAFLTPIAGLIRFVAGASEPELSAVSSGRMVGLEHQALDYDARIVLAHPEDANVDNLIHALREEGIKVLTAKRYDSDWVSLLRETQADALLISLDKDLESNFAEIEEVVQEATVPVFFNEYTAHSNSENYKDMSRQLADKLLSYKKDLSDTVQVSA